DWLAASHFPSSLGKTPHLTDREGETHTTTQGSDTTDLKMLALMNRLLDWFKSLFWKEEMELTLVGLQYSGKTTFVNVIASGHFSEDMIPTVGFNMRKVTKGNVTIKIWDIGGQPRFRSMWERYCRGVNSIVYMVDAADQEKVEASRNELHNLLDKPQLQGIPVSVLLKSISRTVSTGNWLPLLSRIWQLFRTERYAATRFPAKRKTTLTSHFSGSSSTQNPGGAKDIRVVFLLFLPLYCHATPPITLQ
ncbi:hypothetical protein FQN60_009468, partial [Etheostoma spectabile]